MDPLKISNAKYGKESSAQLQRIQLEMSLRNMLLLQEQLNIKMYVY